MKDFSGVDCALVAVKNYSLAEIAPPATSLAAQGALIVPLLNGVEVVDQLVANGVPQEQLVGGLTAISVVRTEPGVFERRSPFQRVVLGEDAESCAFRRMINEASEAAQGCMLGVRPEAVLISPGAKPGYEPIEAHIIEPLGAYDIVDLKIGKQFLRARTASGFVPRVGEKVWAKLNEGQTHFFSAGTGQSLHIRLG